MTYLKKIRFPLITFLLSYLILIIAFGSFGMYPFGDRQIMIIDSWHQYYPALQTFHAKLTHFDSLFYTWQTGAGTNFLLMMAYYAMSPLNLLSLLVPATYLREFMFFITLFKIAAGGGLFAYYLQRKHQIKDLSITIFGLLYAFCGFFLGYYWNVMWLDAVMLLPLAILGLKQVMFEKKFLLYVMTLTYIVITNFYIAYLICEFIGLYALFSYFIDKKVATICDFFKTIGRVIGYSLLSIGLSMIVLLPVIKGMQLAYGLASPNPTKVKLYSNFLDLVNRLLALTTPAVIDGMPNITVGALGLLFAILYFILPLERVKSKALYGLLFALLMVSLNVNILNFIWHGFHFPNQVPYRFAFVISFLLLTMGYKAYLHLQTITASSLIKVAGLILFYLLLMEKIGIEEDAYQALYATIILILAYTTIFSLALYKKIPMRFALKIVLIVLAAELTASTLVAIEEAGSSGRNNYPAQNVAVQHVLANLKEKDADFYRLEMYPMYSANDPLLYGYRGVTQFSSTANTEFNAFTKTLGLSSDQASNSYKYLPNTPVANGLLNIKYMLSKNEELAMPNSAYQKIDSYGDVAVYENKYSFPFGFATSYDILNISNSNISPFARQEKLLSAITTQPYILFESFDYNSENYSNLNAKSASGIRHHYDNIDSTKEGHVSLIYTTPKRGQVYLYLKNHIKEATLTRRDKTTTYKPQRGVVMDLGILEKGESFTLDFDVKAQKSGYFDVEAVLFDKVAFSKQYSKIIANPLVIEHFSDTTIEGHITLSENLLLYTSIPYEKGWRVYVDGKKTTPLSLNKGVLMVPVSKGTHHIVLKYLPDGFILGVCLSTISLILLIALMTTDKKRKLLKIKRSTNKMNLC